MEVGNPYRWLTKLRPQWSLVLLLSLVWGWWIYDGHFGEYADEPANDAERMALLCMDRSLRFQDSLESSQTIVRWWVGWIERDEALRDFRDGFTELHQKGALGTEGQAALATLHMELGETPPPGFGTSSPIRGLLDFRSWKSHDFDSFCKRLEDGQAHWWERTIARRMLAREDPSAEWRLRDAVAIDARRDVNLVRRFWITSTIELSLVIGGFFFLPAAIRRTRAGWTNWRQTRRREYPWRWKFSLTLGVFLLADIAALFYAFWLYGKYEFGEMTFSQELVADLIWRIIAPAVALLILFRKPRHAIRVLRLDRAACWVMVFAVFSILYLADTLLYESVGRFMKLDPTGGLSSLEGGLQGLVFGLLSACIAAPLVEEIMFRGILLRGLERTMGFGLAVIASSIPFAVSHFYDPYGLLSCLLFGIAAAVVYRATGSLRTAIALHVLYNLTITLPSWWKYHADF